MTSTILIIFGQILSGNTQNRKIRPQGLDLGGSTASNQDAEALFPDFEDYDVKICLKFSVTVDRNNFLVYHKTFLLSCWLVGVFAAIAAPVAHSETVT